jgi:hypothetical protein
MSSFGSPSTSLTAFASLRVTRLSPFVMVSLSNHVVLRQPFDFAHCVRFAQGDKIIPEAPGGPTRTACGGVEAIRPAGAPLRAVAGPPGSVLYCSVERTSGPFYLRCVW